LISTGKKYHKIKLCEAELFVFFCDFLSFLNL